MWKSSWGGRFHRLEGIQLKKNEVNSTFRCVRTTPGVSGSESWRIPHHPKCSWSHQEEETPKNVPFRDHFKVLKLLKKGWCEVTFAWKKKVLCLLSQIFPNLEELRKKFTERVEIHPQTEKIKVPLSIFTSYFVLIFFPLIKKINPKSLWFQPLGCICQQINKGHCRVCR